jgi:hypothetical protein
MSSPRAMTHPQQRQYSFTKNGFMLTQYNQGNGESKPSSPTTEEPTRVNVLPNEDSNSTEEGRTKEAARLASLVMNLKLTNEDNTSGAAPQDKKKKTGPTHDEVLRKYSRSTRHRVRKTKAYLELKYQMLRNFQVHDLPEPDENDDDDGRFTKDFGYNPLQTLRNRQYKKYSVSQNKDHLYWNVDPMELVNDYSWSMRNMDLVKKRDGSFVFPQQQHQQQLANRKLYSQSSSSKGGDEFIQKLKSKLIQRSSSSHGASESDSSIDELSPPPSVHDKGVASPDRGRSMSPVRNIAIESISTRRSNDQPRQSAPELGQPIDLKPKSDPTYQSMHQQEKEEEKTEETVKDKSASISAPKTQKENTTNENEDVETLARLANEMQYLNAVFFLANMQTQRKNQVSCPPDNTCITNLSNGISETSKNCTNGLIPEVENKLKDLENRLSAIRDEFGEKRAPKMDNILVESDKILGEVSTTLNLEIRKVGERLDKVEAFAPSPAKLLWTIGYGMLEWSLVIFMWFIWGFVSILRLLKSSFRLILSIIKWLLWC